MAHFIGVGDAGMNSDQSESSNLHTRRWQVLAEAMWQIAGDNCPYMADFIVNLHPCLILLVVDLSWYTLLGQIKKKCFFL